MQQPSRSKHFPEADADFRSLMLFLQEEEYPIPQALLRLHGS